MPHYPIERWIDYTRGFGDTALRAAMEAHLQSGCEPCSALVQLVSRFSGQMSQEQTLDTLTKPLTRMAESIFVPRPTTASIWERITAALVYDSRLDPLPAGTRSGASSAQHLLFSAGSYKIDLRSEWRSASPSLSIVGQVLTEGADAPPPIEARLRVGARTVVETKGNEFGEFSFDCDPHPKLQLFVLVPERQQEIELDLKTLIRRDNYED